MISIKVLKAILNILDALSFLYTSSIAYNRFIILVKLPGRYYIIKVKTIHSPSLVNLYNKIKKFYNPLEKEPNGFTKPFIKVCLVIL